MESDNTPSPYAGLANKIRSGKSLSTIEFENRPPELCIKRGFAGRMGRGIVDAIVFAYRDWIASSSVRLLVDDVEVGQLNQDEQLKVQVEPGLRRIRLECAIARSNEITHEFAKGDRLTLVCRTKLNGIVLLK